MTALRKSAPTPSYFVVMIDYGRKGREAVVDPEITRAGVVDRVRSREYDRINFIHHIHDGVCEDVTNDILKDAGFYEDGTSEPLVEALREGIRDMPPLQRLAWKNDVQAMLATREAAE